MQPTELQVQRSMQALLDAAPGRDPRDEEPGRAPSEVAPEVLEALLRTPAVRRERLLGARTRLESGEWPSDADLANRLVGRLVCDRLR